MSLCQSGTRLIHNLVFLWKRSENMTKLINEINYIRVRNQEYLKLENMVADKGYIKVEPDFFEPYDWFLQTNTRINPASMVKLIEPSGDVLLLRPDVTTNIIKQLSPYWDEAATLKMYYNATTFRQKKQRIIQTRQFGIEYLGDSSIASEIELIEIALDIFSRFDTNFKLSIGNQYLLDQLFASFDKTQKNDIKKAISIRDITTYRLLTSDIKNDMVEGLFDLTGSIDEVLKKLQLMNQTKIVSSYITFLESLNQLLKAKNRNRITIDLALLPEYDYYSGIVIQGYLRNVPTPILSGGRYDKLTKQYGPEIPAVGISFDLQAYIKEVSNE